MKLEYQKPYLAVESFQLNAAIAGSCGSKKYKLNHGTSDCTLAGYPDVKTEFFGGKCKVDVVWDDPTVSENELCYQAVNNLLADEFLDS